MRHFLAEWRCKKSGHDWFPESDHHREFVPVVQVCFRCHVMRALLPWGQCLGGHPIAQHYDVDGNLVDLASCPDGPQ